MRRVAFGTGLVLTASLVAVTLLALTGGVAPAAIPGLPDPGLLTRLGLPILQPVRDLAAAVTVGALVLAACCLPPASLGSRDQITGARRAALDLAAVAAATWCWVSVTLIAFSLSDADGTSVLSQGTLGRAWFFARSFEVGRYLAATAVIAALVLIGCLRARRTTSAGLLAVLAVLGLWPMALAGHAADSLNHEDTVNLQAMHLLGVSVWVGGLITLVVLRRHLGQSLVPTVRRYSTLAGWCLALVAVSGVVGGALRLPSLGAVTSTYGALLALKVSAVLALSAFGWWHRARLIDRLAAGEGRAFWRLAGVETFVLAATAGTAVALSRTAPPAPEGGAQPLSAAQVLLGYDLPPELGAAQWFTQWRVDLFWLPIAAAALVWYLLAVRRLRARGDSWPVLRTICWVIGCLLLAWATSGSPGAYSRVLFSMHMVQHMTIATAVPVFLVLGGPVTLALRTLRRRTDGSMGPREWLLRAVHSPLAYLLGHPIVAGGMFVVSLAGFYYSSAFELSLSTHTGHLLMIMHFLLSGYILANCLVGIDPGPARPPFPLRALLLMITFAFHAFFSVSLMASSQVLAEGWYAALDRPWGASLLEDQYTGASIGWALGDYPLAILAGTLVALWVGSDRRERRRFDRKADRDGDQELSDYNAYLNSLSSRSPVQAGARRPPSPEDP